MCHGFDLTCHRLVFTPTNPLTVSELLEGPSDLQDATFSHDGQLLTLVAASAFRQTATAMGDSSSSKGSQKQGADKMESCSLSSGASEEAVADADGDDGMQRWHIYLFYLYCLNRSHVFCSEFPMQSIPPCLHTLRPTRW